MKRLLASLITLFLLLSFSGCGGNEYPVDYDGTKDFFEGARDSYPAGSEVTLRYTLIATDTDYTFLLDEEELTSVSYDGTGYVITFTMPEHPVKVRVHHENSMVQSSEEDGESVAE